MVHKFYFSKSVEKFEGGQCGDKCPLSWQEMSRKGRKSLLTVHLLFIRDDLVLSLQ